MSRFYVGQRVRIKWSHGWPEIAGEVGTIVDVADGSRSVDGRPGDWIVAPDAWGSPKAPAPSPDGGVIFGPCEDQLEPATDSYDKTEWKDCLWQPEHLRETV